MPEPFVPPDFAVPSPFEDPAFHLEPLGPEHNERDHAAWMSSIDHIHATPGFEPDAEWPTPMTLEKNLADLVGHSRDFERREGFTYSILVDDDVIGCVYIYPSKDLNHDAVVRSWVCERRSEMDMVVWRALSKWIETTWPFESPAYAVRT